MPNRFSKVGAQQVALLGGNAKMASDPKRNQTVLHLSTLGAIRGEQNNTFVDDSPNRYTITRTGNVAPSTFSPYGDSWSNYFNGSTDYLSVNRILDTAGDVTVEAWVYMTATPPVNAGYVVSQYVGAGADRTFFGVNQNRTIGMQCGGTGGNGTTALALNTWHHLAWVRSGSGTNNFKMYANGVLEGQVTYTGSFQNTPTTIGATPNLVSTFFSGSISNLRIVKGAALYTTDFMPSKTPLTAVSGTSLLTCASNRFQDKSSNNFAITPNGNVAVKTASPFPQAREFKKPQRGWCVPFDGSTQRLETPAASVANGLQLGTSDFTIECWVKAKPQSNYARVIDACVHNNPNYSWYIASGLAGPSTNGQFSIYTGTSATVSYISLPNIFDNSWKHVAIVRISNTIYGYIDGVLVGSSAIAVAGQNLNYTTPIVLGAARSPSAATYNSYFSGKISNVMIVKKALYSGNFVPMGSPRAADQNGTLPVLLTCQGGAVMDYSYSSQTLTSAGSLVVDSDGPFDQDDESSYYFDGNGDYLSIADNAALELGSGDFTIETWVNLTAYQTTINTGGSIRSTVLRKDTGYQLSFWSNNTTSWGGLIFFHYTTQWNTSITVNYAFNLNTWYHIAFTRSGTTATIYINGVSAGTGTISGTLLDSANSLLIGATNGAGFLEYFPGNISNLRIVKGAALYTANFTPSRKPLPIASSGSTALLTCRGRTAADQSNNNLTVTVFGTAGTTANPVSRKSPFREDERYGMSYYFDGSADYLTANPAVATPFAFGTGDYTIEGWINPTSLPAVSTIADFRAATSTIAPLIDLTSVGVLRLYAATTLICSSTSGAIKIGQWNHFAISRSGTTLKMFVNGNQEASATNSSNIVAGGTTKPIIGVTLSSTNPFAGYISGISAQKSVAKYTAAFTPPSSPQLTGDYSQSLLINAYPAIYDTTRKNAIETVGSYAAANAGVVYGKGAERYSAYFTGASDYLTIPNSPDFDFGTGDFTIETWVYINGNSAADSGGGKTAAIISCYASSTQGWMLNIGGNATTTGIGLWLETHNAGTYANTVTPTISISQTTWHHIAVTRSSGVVRFFLNGTQQGSNLAFTTSLSSGGGQVLIGGTSYSGYPRYLYGGLHDLRVTKGFARYTSNFTLPILLPIK